MARTLMPKSNLQFKERSARRAIRAACKEGLIVGAVEIAPDGTIRVLTGPGQQIEPASDLNEWEAAYGKPAT